VRSPAGPAPFRSLASAVTARVSYEGLERLFGSRRPQPWGRRQNYRGRPVSLAGGAALAISALGTVLVDRRIDARVRHAAIVAGGAAALAGAFDDLRGSGAARGLRGHLGALRRGEITTGTVKVAVIGAGAMASAWAVAGRGIWRPVAAGTVVAASANLVNLLDLRPGRALKASLLVAVPLTLSPARGRLVAGAAGAAAAGLLAVELDERAMLGDAGANCLGALIGVALISGASTRRLLGALGALVTLTAASEAVSFSQVIDMAPPLRWLDRLGRRGETADA
jgi:UDP-N-acetylmuramyl pentapeptide phosphotransferase/UDP-N-acetylglucosamine-1-phosphate transferase